MILRKIGEAIRRQDWFVVVLEVLIVVFGVYIGIYVGDIQAEREHAVKTDQALEALETELRSDLVRIGEVIELQIRNVGLQEDLVRLWGSEQADGDEIVEILETLFSDNSTFFPNRAAYNAMQTGGYLASLPDDKLRLQLTRLFEREYDRQEVNGSLYDGLFFDFSILVVANNWDRVNGRPIGAPADAHATLRNGMITVRDQARFYLKFISEQVRPDMIATLELIDAYQAAGRPQAASYNGDD